MSYPNSKKLPWFMIPYYATRTLGASNPMGGFSANFIITTDTVPKEVTDTKQLNYNEQQLPGGYTSIYKYGSAGARKISFKLEIADFNDDVGLGLKLSQFDLLRRPEIKIAARTDSGDIDYKPTNLFLGDRYTPFHSNPYVIYYNSIFNSIPLPFQVLKCDFTTSKPNRLGKPQYAVIDFELVQMEDHWLSAIEDKAKYALAVVGAVGQSIPSLMRSLKSGNSRQNTYKNKKSKLGF